MIFIRLVWLYMYICKETIYLLSVNILQRLLCIIPTCKLQVVPHIYEQTFSSVPDIVVQLD
jgi:hypothetical protein